MTKVLPAFAKQLIAIWFLSAWLFGDVYAETHAGTETVINNVKVTVLSTNLAEIHGRGEWGWSALVEADGRCILFDSGNHPDTVIDNARAMNVDLSCVREVVLSHHHFDHTGGVLSLFNALTAEHGKAFSTVHVAEGFFYSRPRDGGKEGNTMIATRDTLAARGVEFVVHDSPAEIRPGIWVTGPIERVHPEKNYPAQLRVALPGGIAPDHIPESQGLAVMSPEGFVVVLGCGHAGVVNALTHIRKSIARQPIAAVMGGFHLFGADEPTLDWVAERLAEIKPAHVMGAHCTGVEPLYHIRQGAGMSRETAVIGSVGGIYLSGEGFKPGPLAR